MNKIKILFLLSIAMLLPEKIYSTAITAFNHSHEKAEFKIKSSNMNGTWDNKIELKPGENKTLDLGITKIEKIEGPNSTIINYEPAKSSKADNPTWHKNLLISYDYDENGKAKLYEGAAPIAIPDTKGEKILLSQTQYPLQFQNIANKSPYEARIYIVNNKQTDEHPMTKKGGALITPATCIKIKPQANQDFDNFFLPYPQDGYLIFNLLDKSEPENTLIVYTYVIFNCWGQIIIINASNPKDVKKSIIPHFGNTGKTKSDITIKNNGELGFTIPKGKDNPLTLNNTDKFSISFNNNIIRTIENLSQYKAYINITSKAGTQLSGSQSVVGDCKYAIEPKSEPLAFDLLQIPLIQEGFMIISLLSPNEYQENKEDLQRYYILYNSNYNIYVIDPLARDKGKGGNENPELYKKFNFKRDTKSANKSVFSKIEISNKNELKII